MTEKPMTPKERYWFNRKAGLRGQGQDFPVLRVYSGPTWPKKIRGKKSERKRLKRELNERSI